MTATRRVGHAIAVVLAGTLAGCTSSGGGGAGDGGGSTLSNLFLYGGTTIPPAAGAAVVDVVDCPPVVVSDGGAALRANGSGDTVRSQIAIANVARECTGRPDGAVVVKVGVEGRVLLGPGGAPGRFDAPVSFVLKRGERVLASRSRRVAATVAPGTSSGDFVVVEDGLVVPAGTGEFEIEVGLGAGPKTPAPSRRAGRG